jgi:3-deoxy-7-phosphoheptulonate synthase
LDVAAVAVLKRETHLPVIVDPSHAAGTAHLVKPLAFAAIAVGADGLIVEVHPAPETALSDGDQSLSIDAFEQMMHELQPFAAAAGRTLQTGARPEAHVA